jgi:hypothetical protein
MPTDASDLAAGQIAMVAKARYTYERIAVCTNLFTKYTLDAGEKSKYIPKFASGGSAADLTDGVDMTDETALTITGTTHTTDEAGCKVIITKKLRAQLKEDAYVAAGKVIGNMMGRKIDEDGVALFSGLSNVVGAAGSILAIGSVAAAVSQLEGQSEPVPKPYVCVLHPHTINGIIDQITVPAATYAVFPDSLNLPLLRDYWKGAEKIYGVNIFTDGNISANSTAYGALFAPETFIYLVGWEPENWVEEDKSLRGWEIGVVADYAMVENDDSYGRAMYFTAVAPTS